MMIQTWLKRPTGRQAMNDQVVLQMAPTAIVDLSIVKTVIFKLQEACTEHSEEPKHRKENNKKSERLKSRRPVFALEQGLFDRQQTNGKMQSAPTSTGERAVDR